MELCSMKTLTILKNALGSIHASPLQVDFENNFHGKTVYLHEVNQTVKEKMSDLGYKLPDQDKIDSDYAEWLEKQSTMPEVNFSEDSVKQKIQNSIEKLIAVTKSTNSHDVKDEDNEWCDISNSSLLSNSSQTSTSRANSLVRVKAKIKQSMRESSSKRTTRLAQTSTGLTPQSKKQKLILTSDCENERQPRSRQPKFTNDPHAARTEKSLSCQRNTRAVSTDRAEFARQQNQRVQKIKEKRSQLDDHDRKEQTKPTKSIAEAPSAKFPALKAKSSVSNTKATIKQKTEKVQVERLEHSMQIDSHPINSTFYPGVPPTPPMFNATLSLDGPAIGSTPVCDATFVLAKPTIPKGVLKMPATPRTMEDTIFTNCNETYKDYGIDDLCSDSDNTDDEARPSKPVPSWAKMSSTRFKNRLAKQKRIGNQIQKYGIMNIVVPNTVDLESIFQGPLDLQRNLNTSSFLWDTTQTFIEH